MKSLNKFLSCHRQIVGMLRNQHSLFYLYGIYYWAKYYNSSIHEELSIDPDSYTIHVQINGIDSYGDIFSIIIVFLSNKKAWSFQLASQYDSQIIINQVKATINDTCPKKLIDIDTQDAQKYQRDIYQIITHLLYRVKSTIKKTIHKIIFMTEGFIRSVYCHCWINGTNYLHDFPVLCQATAFKESSHCIYPSNLK